MENINKTIKLNEFKLLVFIAIISAIIAFFGYIITEVFELGMMGVYATLLAVIGINFFSYFFSKNIVLKSQGAIPMAESEFSEYYDMVKTLCQRAKMPLPELYYIKSSALNAFATGRSRKNSAVVVTTGLLKALNIDELSGVIGHELSHILHNDILITSFITTMVGYITILASTIRSASIYKTSNNKNSNSSLFFLAITASILTPVITALIRMAISRSREYMADATGAYICQNPLYLANALYKISHDEASLDTANEAVAPLYISNPLKNNFIANLFSTHPDINDRIQRLQKMA